MRIDIDGTGEVVAVATVYTTVIYEQQFKSSMIADVYGKVAFDDADLVKVVTPDFVKGRLRAALGKGEEMPEGAERLVDRAFPSAVVAGFDYTKDNWGAYLKALWAMLRTADELGESERPTPGWDRWVKSLGPVDMRQISDLVITECQEKLFRSPAARQQADQG